MSRGDALPDPNWDEFDPNADLDYGEDGDEQGTEDVAEPSPSANFPVVEPQEPSSSRSARVASAELPVPDLGMTGNIGPSLPPGFLLESIDDSAPEDPGDSTGSPNRGEDVNLPTMPSGSNGNRIFGPLMPAIVDSTRQIGPSLPPNLVEAGPSLPEDETSDVEDVSQGPPPEPSQPLRAIGPALPPGFLNGAVDEPDEPDEADLYGPTLPANIGMVDVPDEDDDEVVVGPMPLAPGGVDQDRAAEEYAYRRLALEEANEAKKNDNKREEWMTSLPQKLTNYGLGARTFSKGTGGGEKDSSWTETPQQKRLKLQSSEPSTSSDDVAAAANRARDQEQERIANELNKNRKEALLDTHFKQKKTSAENGSSSSGVRRPFDRERDMEVRGLGNATSEEIKKKCGNLGSRFGSSSNQKFL